MRSSLSCTAKREAIVARGTLLLAMLLRYGYYGLHYFPVLDDNNMYGIFQMMKPAAVLAHYRMYTTRPVANLLDAYVWSRLWDHPAVVLLVMILLHFLSIVFLWKVFEKNNLKTGIIAAAFFGLLPFGTEATYWVAASSRLVVGLFFASLSFYLLMLYIEQSERLGRCPALRLAAFGLASLLSLGFYEQVIAFSFVGAMLLLTANFRRLKSSCRAAILIPLFNLAAIGTYYKIFSHTGNMAARGQLLQGDYLGHTITVLRRIEELLVAGQWQMLKNGTLRGLEIIAADRAYIYLALTVLTGFIFAILAARESPVTGFRDNIIKFLLGASLLIVPFSPFFLLSYTWIANRNAFLSLLGVALLAEVFIHILFTARRAAILRGALLGVLVFAFLMANTAEVADYRSVSLTDREICREFIKTAGKAGPGWNKREILLFNARPAYVELTAEHFQNCTSSDWAIMGALQVARGKRGIGHILPVPDGSQFSLPEDRFRRTMYLGIDEGKRVFPLSGRWTDVNILELRKENGENFGEVKRSSGGLFYFRLRRQGTDKGTRQGDGSCV